MKAVLSEKGQVTIPKPVRDRMGLRAGQVLEFREERGRIVVSKAAREDAVEAVYGIVRLREGTDATLTYLRGSARET